MPLIERIKRMLGSADEPTRPYNCESCGANFTDPREPAVAVCPFCDSPEVALRG